MKTYFAFDIETTGVDKEKDQPVEIAFALVPEEGPYRVTSFIVSPTVLINPEAQKIHGISQVEAAGGLRPSTVAQVLHDILSGNEIDGIIGFNCFNFDVPIILNFLRTSGEKFPIWFFEKKDIEDPALWYLAEKIYKKPIPRTREELKEISTIRVPYGTRYNLGALCSIYGIKNKEAHRAEGDLRATVELWREMKNCRRIRDRIRNGDGTAIDAGFLQGEGRG